MSSTQAETTALVHDLARRTCGVTSRQTLRAYGVDRHAVRRLAHHGHVEPLGLHAIRVNACEWHPVASPVVAAVLNSGASAWAEGESALALDGLPEHVPAAIDVGVPENATTRVVTDVRRHRIRHVPPLRSAPVAHAAPSHAALRAAAWAADDDAAVTLLHLVVGHHLASPASLARALESMPTLTRHPLVALTVHDLARSRGAASLETLSLPRLCRQRGLPEPDLEELHRYGNGAVVLEARWHAARLTVRIDSVHRPLTGHGRLVERPRQTLAVDGDTILQTSRFSLGREESAFFAHLAAALEHHDAPRRRSA